MTTSTVFLLLVAAASTIAFTPPEGSHSRVRRSQTSSSGSYSASGSTSGAGVGSAGAGHNTPAAKSYQGGFSYQGSSSGYQGGGFGIGSRSGSGSYQGGGGGSFGGQYPYYPSVHTAPFAQPFDFASLFGYLQQLQALVMQQQRQQQLAFSHYAPGEAWPDRRVYSWHAATTADPWRSSPSFAHSNAMFFNKGFGGYSDLDSNTLGERFGAAAGGGAAGGAYSGSFSGSGSGNFGGGPGFGSGFGSGNAGGQPFVFGSSGPASFGGQSDYATQNRFGGQSGFGGGFPGFGSGGGSSGGDGAVGAAASAAIGPQGGFQMGSLFPDSGLSSRFGGDISPPAGNTYGVFTSSSSGSSDINGKKTSFKTATVGVNDNGKVTYKTVHDP